VVGPPGSPPKSAFNGADPNCIKARSEELRSCPEVNSGDGDRNSARRDRSSMRQALGVSGRGRRRSHWRRCWSGWRGRRRLGCGRWMGWRGWSGRSGWGGRSGWSGARFLGGSGLGPFVMGVLLSEVLRRLTQGGLAKRRLGGVVHCTRRHISFGAG